MDMVWVFLILMLALAVLFTVSVGTKASSSKRDEFLEAVDRFIPAEFDFDFRPLPSKIAALKYAREKYASLSTTIQFLEASLKRDDLPSRVREKARVAYGRFQGFRKFMIERGISMYMHGYANPQGAGLDHVAYADPAILQPIYDLYNECWGARQRIERHFLDVYGTMTPPEGKTPCESLSTCH